MPDLTYQRCFNHARREAVVQCPVCRRFFCRECVTEHEDRMVCAACLSQLARVPFLRRRGVLSVLGAARCLLGVLIAWFFFFLVGQRLLALPTAVHEGTLWHVPWLDRESPASDPTRDGR